MSDAADSYVQDWRAARPLRDLALRFVPADAAGLCSLLALQEQLFAARLGSPEPGALKLAWWAEELAGFGRVAPRHPLTQALQADARSARVPTAAWAEAASALHAALQAPASASAAAQRAAAGAAVEPWARVECAFFAGPQADATRTQQVLALQLLLADLLRLPARAGGGPLPLPLDALARHGLDRAALAADGTARRAALTEQCRWLQAELAQALHRPEPLLPLRALEAAHDHRALRRAARAREPLAALQIARAALTPADAWRCWRQLRRAAPA